MQKLVQQGTVLVAFSHARPPTLSLVGGGLPAPSPLVALAVAARQGLLCAPRPCEAVVGPLQAAALHCLQRGRSIQFEVKLFKQA